MNEDAVPAPMTTVTTIMMGEMRRDGVGREGNLWRGDQTEEVMSLSRRQRASIATFLARAMDAVTADEVVGNSVEDQARDGIAVMAAERPGTVQREMTAELGW